MSAYFVVRKILKKRGKKNMAKSLEDFKTGICSTVSLITVQKLDDYGDKLNASRADIIRKILEFFIEHNDVEDLKE